MEILKFKCELLSDVVLNDTPATKGKAQTLPFIPGNNFLGIAARTLYDKEDERSFLLFHSGRVRFGDANPSLDNMRGVKVPATIQVPKLKRIYEESYVSYLIPNQEAMRPLQLKQCRSGFYSFVEDCGYEVKSSKNFFIKSAYDSSRRRAQDEQMFGLEALQKGLTLYFSVEIDDEATIYKDEIRDALIGRRHVGRSRTAQFGLVQISACDFDEPTSTDEAVELQDKGSCVIVYADSRLIFLDSNGYPTFCPTAEMLGLNGGEILWDKCQVRTFQYAPWNCKLRAYDSDRCGFEKGSVFVVRTNPRGVNSRYVGNYCNEGFGRVIYNPAFLRGDSETARTICHFVKSDEREAKAHLTTPPTLQGSDLTLWQYLEQRASRHTLEESISKTVNDFVDKYGSRFKGEQFASQWGSIRNLAMVIPDPDKLIGAIEGYLNHGVAKDKWEKNGRKKALGTFLSEQKKSDALQELVINLASIMGKYCANNNKQDSK